MAACLQKASERNFHTTHTALPRSLYVYAVPRSVEV